MEDLETRSATIRRMIRERLAALTPAERDQLIQVYIAQGMTIQQRFRATASLIRFALHCARSHGGSNE